MTSGTPINRNFATAVCGLIIHLAPARAARSASPQVETGCAKAAQAEKGDRRMDPFD